QCPRRGERVMREYCKYCYSTHTEWCYAWPDRTLQLQGWDVYRCERCDHTSALPFNRKVHELPTFRSWLLKQRHRTDAVGWLSNCLAKDPGAKGRRFDLPCAFVAYVEGFDMTKVATVFPAAEQAGKEWLELND